MAGPGASVVGRLSIRVLPDTSRFVADLQKMIKRVENSMYVDLEVRANTKAAELSIAKFRNVESRKGINMNVGVKSAIAKAKLAVLARERFATINVKINKKSMAAVESALGQLSGGRVVHGILSDVTEALTTLDKNLPKISRVALGISTIGSMALTSTAGLVTLSGDLANIGLAGYVLPAMFAGMAVGVGTLIAALKDGKKQLAELAPAIHQLQDSISSKFWAQARTPIIDLFKNLLPQLQEGFKVTATALGKQAAAIANAFQNTLGNGVLGAMFARLGETIDIVTGGAGAFAAALTTIGTVGSNYLPRLAGWVVKITEQFNTWIQKIAASGELNTFIETGITNMKLLGTALSGAVGILRAIDKAAAAAGGGGLATFAANLKGASDIMNSPAFQTALTTILKGANSALDGLGGGIIKVGQMFEALAPQIGGALGAAGETVGGLLGAIADAMNQPVFKEGLTNFFNGLQAGVKALEPAMTPLFALIGTLGTTLGIAAANFGPLLAILKETFAPIVEGLITAVTPLIPLLAGGLTSAITALGPLFSGLGSFIKDNQGFIEGMALGILGLVAAIKTVSFVQFIAGWVASTAAMVINKAETIILMGMYAKDMVLGLAKTVAGLVISTGAWIANTVAMIASKVALVAGAIATGVATVAQYALNLAMTLNPIGLIIAAIVAVIAALIWFFTQTELGKEIWANFTKWIGEAWTNIVNFVTTAVGLVSDVIGAVVGFIVSMWQAYWNLIFTVVSAVWGFIVDLVTNAINGVVTVVTTVGAAIASVWSGIWSTITGVVSTAWNGITGFVGKIVSGISGMVGSIGGAIAGIPKMVGDAFAGAGTWLLNAGKSIIQGLIDGIGKMVRAAGNAAANVMKTISNFFPHSPAKEGPFSGRGWTLYSGQAMGDGLVDGMSSRIAQVRASALAMMGAASVTGSVTIDDASSTRANTDGATGDRIIVQGNVGYNPAQIAAEIDLKKRQAAMANGLNRVVVA